MRYFYALLLILLSIAAPAQRQLVIPHGSRYYHHEYNRVERQLARVKRKNRRLNNRDLRTARKENRHRQQLLADLKKKRQQEAANTRLQN